MKKHCVAWQTLLLVLVLAAAHVIAPVPSTAGTAKGVQLSPKVADPQTDFLAVQVGSHGTFNMGANPFAVDCGFGPTFPAPCRYNLMFFWPFEPGTSFTTVRIDSLDFLYSGDIERLVVPPTDTDPFSNL